MLLTDSQIAAKREKFLAKNDGSDPLESKIEERWNKIAKRLGWVKRKFRSPQNNSVPDRIYFRAGVCFMIEFKRRGKKPSPAQQQEHAVLRKQGGMSVYVIDRIDDELAELVFM